MREFERKIMYLTLVLMSILTVVRGSSEDGESIQEDSVIHLTDDNFDVENGALENSLVMFHAPWCGHCQRLSPEFTKAASVLKNDDPHPVFLVKVDCTAEGKETCRSFNIRGYPTLKIFKGGDEVADYRGTRQSNGIVEYMRKHLKEEKEEKSDL